MSSLPKVCKRPKSQPRGWELLLRLPRSGQPPAWPNPAAGGVGWVGTQCVGAAGGCWGGLVSSEGPMGAWGTQPLCSSPRRGVQVLWTSCRSFWVSRRSPPSVPACKLAGSRSAQRFPWVLSPGVPGGCGHLLHKASPCHSCCADTKRISADVSVKCLEHNNR